MRTRGFTIVELLVVITVMAILIPVTMFSIGGLNKVGRDRERESDASAIARQLELVYTNKTVDSSPTYPGTVALNAADRDATFGGNTVNITRAPGSNIFSIRKANNNVASPTGVSPQPATTGDTQYIYQPIDKNGNGDCPSLCARFNLYYFNESDNKVVMIKSQRQQ